MMRLNAPIPATLALAVLWILLPVCGMARPTRYAAHKASSHRLTVATAGTRAGTVRRGGKAAVARGVSRSGLRGGAREKTAGGMRRTATTRVRGGRSFSEARARRVRPAERARMLRASRSTKRYGQVSRQVSRQVSVVSVIRPVAQKPQLPSVEEAASTPVILPALYNKRGRLMMPAPLRGSHEILVHQNEVADRDGLGRIQNDGDLFGMRERGLLIAVPENEGIEVDERLPANRRFCRPWTASFLTTLARAHYARFHTRLQVNSAVRTVEFQQHLLHINGNAAPAGGDTASPHLTGQAVDIAKRGLSLSEIAWLRGYLLPLVQEGKVDVEEEFQQSCFHISVYKQYAPTPTMPERDLALATRAGTPALAAAIR